MFYNSIIVHLGGSQCINVMPKVFYITFFARVFLLYSKAPSYVSQFLVTDFAFDAVVHPGIN